MIVRAGERFRWSQPGIESWHVFSAGPHYDPARLGVGPLIGVDEHLLAPGAGFAEHAHRRVDIVSWVLSGTLRHRAGAAAGGRRAGLLVEPGQVLVQRAGEGVRHIEDNPSGTHPLRLLQMTVMSANSTPSTRLAELPAQLGTARLELGPVAMPGFVIVVSGQWRCGGIVLGPGDAGEVDETPVGTGTLLTWLLQ